LGFAAIDQGCPAVDAGTQVQDLLQLQLDRRVRVWFAFPLAAHDDRLLARRRLRGRAGYFPVMIGSPPYRARLIVTPPLNAESCSSAMTA
jgi:hypothetical protein